MELTAPVPVTGGMPPSIGTEAMTAPQPWETMVPEAVSPPEGGAVLSIAVRYAPPPAWTWLLGVSNDRADGLPPAFALMIAAMTRHGSDSGPVAPELGAAEVPNPLLVLAVVADATCGQPRTSAVFPPAVPA